MDARKLKMIEELLHYLAGSQGDEIKDMMDADKAPSLVDGVEKPEEDESPLEGMLGKKSDAMAPKGIKVEKVEILGKKPGMDEDEAPEIEVGGMPEKKPGNEISSDDLDELYKKYRGC